MHFISTGRPGAYSLVVNAQGFQTSSLPSIQLFVGTDMVPGCASRRRMATQQVTVSAAAPLLTQSSGEVGTVIEQKRSPKCAQWSQLLQLNLLAPGVTRSKNSKHLRRSSNRSYGPELQREWLARRYNAYLLDGTNIKNTTPVHFVRSSVDAIQEFQ